MSDWVLAYEGFAIESEGLREALCTLGNGVFATRGAAPEVRGGGGHYPGTYVAGCYDRLVTRIDGHDVENEDLVNVPNWLPLSVRPAGGRWFEPSTANLLEYRQELDLRTGKLTRQFRFTDEVGTTRVIQRRIVSMDNPHLAALETTVVAEDWEGTLEVRSALDGRVTNAGVPRYAALRGDHLVLVESGSVGDDDAFLETETRTSRVRIAQAFRTRVLRNGDGVDVERTSLTERGVAGHLLAFGIERDQPVTIEKVVSLFTSLDSAIYEPAMDARTLVARAPGFDELLERHTLAWDHLWRRFDIVVESDESAQLGLRLHVFHLLQTVSPHTIDRDVGVPARGLHGEAYRGHIFWDELFIFPFLNLRLPALTRSLLYYRFRRLPQARLAAREAGLSGAMYPWQSGSDGREESQALHLNPKSGRWIPDNSRRQRHIAIAIAYNVWQHYQVTGDLEFLRTHGAEMLTEIARFWGGLATYSRSLDRYEICGVMGPDEYHDAYPDSEEPGLDNNAYTNIMAAWVLWRALEMFEILPDHDREMLWERLRITREETGRWEDISRKLYVPFHDEGIVSQFDRYGDLEEFEWEDYRTRYGDIQRLDRILESEGDTPNRYKVAKQADVLMLFYLLSDDELQPLFERLGYPFDPARDVPRNVDYYLRRTAHGSTLSRVVHSWILARLDPARSWRLLREALESDFADTQGGTTPEGIHLGAMAGTVDLVQRCYGGIEARGDVLRIAPVLPSEVTRLAFTMRYRGQRLHVDVSGARVRVSSEEGPFAPVRVGVCGEMIDLPAGGFHEVDLPPPRATSDDDD